ncbi:MAG: DUF5908 family protein [Bacteroidota bacterium]|nr:DUF5908 family protein [Bacteroidota bacterium]
MPVEIRELVIKVVLEETSTKATLDSKVLQDLKNTIVKECTEKILTKLENISDR